MRRSIIFAILLLSAVFVVLAYAAKPTPPPPQTPAIQGIARLDGTVDNPTVGVQSDLVSLTGPGTFIGGRVTSIGSEATQLTVQLEIDGTLVVNENVRVLDEGYASMNPMGIIRQCGVFGTQSGYCLGFIQPVAYNSSLTLSVIPAFAMDNVSGTVLYAD